MLYYIISRLAALCAGVFALPSAFVLGVWVTQEFNLKIPPTIFETKPLPILLVAVIAIACVIVPLVLFNLDHAENSDDDIILTTEGIVVTQEPQEQPDDVQLVMRQ